MYPMDGGPGETDPKGYARLWKLRLSFAGSGGHLVAKESEAEHLVQSSEDWHTLSQSGMGSQNAL